MLKLLNIIKDFFIKYKGLIKTIIISFFILCLITFGFVFVKKVNDYFFKKYDNEKKIIIDNNKKLIEEKNNNLIELNKQLVNRDKTIKELRDKQKYYSQNDLNNIDCKNKDKIILDLQNERDKLNSIIDEDTEKLNKAKKDIEDLKTALENTNNEYAKAPEPKKNSLSPFVMGGLSSPNDRLEFSPDLYVGLSYERTLYNGKLIDIGIEFGGAVKLYKNLGFAVELAPVIRF